jgi:hypothetical protein
VEPRLYQAKPGRIRSAKTKFKLVPWRGLQVRPKLAPATVVRNAIGMPIHPQRADKNGSGTGGTPKPHVGNGGTGVSGLGLRPQASNPVPTNGLHSPATTTMNHSSVVGSIILRPTTAPGVIGGPAKNVVGSLNGTNFRQRHP